MCIDIYLIQFIGHHTNCVCTVSLVVVMVVVVVAMMIFDFLNPNIANTHLFRLPIDFYSDIQIFGFIEQRVSFNTVTWMNHTRYV